ncbi:MAG TPA: ABC transporter permease [Kouleothrix sp.]|jgi:oligopeptide transport system permease protein|uniref:ABC transporter permease n=1 Tax=Kouleothrix sp. TaxID=2779161 RepID=UPI002BF6E944|nr:ABC transporter permease [Kouleothrix sp.]HRC75700.1 ABC transporter permease [Kouleothrix sp.]
MSAIADESALIALSEPQRRPANLWRDAWRRFFKNKLAVGALVVMLLLVVLAVGADVIAPARYDYSVLSEANQFPFRSAKHVLGTDSVGRDFLSRLIYGARVSLLVGFSVQAIAVVIGMSLGTLAGMFGGWVDYIVMRWVEVLTSIPIWLFALFLISIWRGSDQDSGSGVLKVIVAIGLIGWVDICRLTRAQLLSLRQKDYVLAARAIGATPLQIALRHLLPNALAPLIVAITLGVPTAMFTEAGLSFLGFGINDPLPSWGKMVADANAYIRVYWHLGLFPTLLIALTMLSFSFVGDGLRDALDPRTSK